MTVRARMKRPLLSYHGRVLRYGDRGLSLIFGVFMGAAALGCGGGAALAPVDSGAADAPRPDGAAGDGAVNEGHLAGATGLLAANGVAIPDPPLKDPCTALGVATKSCGFYDACPDLTCDCGGVQQTIGAAASCAIAGACLTGVSCPDVCAAPYFASDALFSCVLSGTCHTDADCPMPGASRCLRSLDGLGGHCVSEQKGSDCYRDGDCASSVCVAMLGGQRQCEDKQVGSSCNRNDQCDAPASGIGKSACVLRPGEFQGVCTDASQSAPCLASADCLPGYGCATFDPKEFGQCTSGGKEAPCAADADCGKGLCVTQSRPWGRCDTGELGATCVDGTDCQSGYCFASKCSAATTGAPCVLDTECASHLCASAGPGALMPGQCTDGKPGSPCYGVFSTQCDPGLQCSGAPGTCGPPGTP